MIIKRKLAIKNGGNIVVCQPGIIEVAKSNVKEFISNKSVAKNSKMKISSFLLFTSFWVRLLLTSGGFTSVAAFGTEYSRRGQNEVMEKAVTFYKESSNCVKPLL
ncbi:MAG: hypothetical protein CFE23_16330 [Flavobacterium sp. BFFFF1]|uniref:hypothetical protein n=1 Tax=Flavobacterium sp. BFFFF1 TaxID=2015557 RepID=UPI000BD8D489|nr:hypothetical protein [Flavobacterium sp. BFFFF1]OYU78937.1 MAG: hypothetical protein CFE23_16330 [Flavobacterium sp. BFFFF1]